MNEDSLGDRMKLYEGANRTYLPQHLPVILRVDGRAFHSYTSRCERPFDKKLMAAMDAVAIELCEEVNNCKMAYVQSDEISLLVQQNGQDAQPWFANNIQKMVSIAASVASVKMTLQSEQLFGESKSANFDARVFVLPPHEVVNYYIWRQQDWIRNSVQMLSRSYFSHSQLDGKSQTDMHEMLHQKDVNWALLAPSLKNGRCVIKRDMSVVIPAGPMKGETVIRPKWVVDNEIPIFTQNRQYVESLIKE
jgi:tRNA(His) guanylyltransferase